MFYTDQSEVYKGVIPAARHRAIFKLARKTNHIERFNCTLRQHPAGGLAHKRRVHHEIAQREMGPEAAGRQAKHIRGQPQCSPTGGGSQVMLTSKLYSGFRSNE